MWKEALLILGLAASKSSHQDYTFEWKYSLYAPYVNSGGHSHNWEIDGIVNNYHHVQLTPDMPGKSGSVFSKQKYNSNDWFIEMSFQIKSANPHSAGDGMALWFVEDFFSPGPAFGHSARFKGLGIFFDLYQNKRSHKKFPYVSAMVNDGTKQFDHSTDGEATSLGGCHAKILNTETPIHAKVIYHNSVLEVLLFTNHDAGWTPCLKVANVRLPSSGFIGVTALTGDATAKHDLIGITTGSYHAGTGDSIYNGDIEAMEQRHANYFFILLLISLAAGGYQYYKSQKKKNIF